MPIISGAKCDRCESMVYTGKIERKKDIAQRLRSKGWSVGMHVYCPEHNPRSEAYKIKKFERLIREACDRNISMRKHFGKVERLRNKIENSSLMSESKAKLNNTLTDKASVWYQHFRHGSGHCF